MLHYSEALLSLLGTCTQRIRIGTGGLQLHYCNPLRVAHTFQMLESLFPGRIELGICRGPGVASDQMKVALDFEDGTDSGFEEKATKLAGYMAGSDPELCLPQFHPKPLQVVPPLWLLGASPRSLAFATEVGYQLALPLFLISGSEQLEEIAIKFRKIRAAQQTLRKKISPTPTVITVSVLCRETNAEANRLLQNLSDLGGRIPNVVGDPDECCQALVQLSDAFDDAQILVLPALHPEFHSYTDKKVCYELLADAAFCGKSHGSFSSNDIG